MLAGPGIFLDQAPSYSIRSRVEAGIWSRRPVQLPIAGVGALTAYSLVIIVIVVTGF